MEQNQGFRTEKEFEIEKNAKNRAYAFILSNGLLDSFAQFCKETSSIDNLHPFCKKQLLTRSNKTTKIIESTEKVSKTTELLKEAFSKIHEKVFAPRDLDEDEKFQEIATPIILALNTMSDFSCNYDVNIVNILDSIKHECKGNFETQVSGLCSEILQLKIAANRFYETYSLISMQIQHSLDESHSK